MVYMRGLANNWQEGSWLGLGILRTTAMNQIYLFENFETAVMDWSHVNWLRFDATSNIYLTLVIWCNNWLQHYSSNVKNLFMIEITLDNAKMIMGWTQPSYNLPLGQVHPMAIIE